MVLLVFAVAENKTWLVAVPVLLASTVDSAELVAEADRMDELAAFVGPATMPNVELAEGHTTASGT